MRHLSTVHLLVEWARWGAANNIDYPSMSPMFGERALKSPLFGIGHIPDDVFWVEQCVCRLYWPSRQIIILRYQHRLTFTQMGERINRTKWTAIDRLRAAEGEVHHELKKVLVGNSPTRVYFMPDSKTVST